LSAKFAKLPDPAKLLKLLFKIPVCASWWGSAP